MALIRSGYWPDRLVKRVTRAVHWFGVFFILAMMLLTAADVVGRYFFNKPIYGAFEITELMLPIAAFCGMAYAAVTKAHISVDTIVERLSPRGQARLGSITSLASLFFFALLSWQSVAQSNLQRVRGDIYGLIEPVTWPFPLVIAAGSALVCLVVLPVFLQQVSTAWKGRWQSKLGLFLGVFTFALICVFAFRGSELPWQMSQLMTGLVGLIFMLVMLLCGMWVGVAMGLAAILGIAYIQGMDPALSFLGAKTFENMTSYTLAVIPLFILMGEFAHNAGLSEELYTTMYKWLGRLPGGLAMATVGACAGFAAVCGDTAATIVTIGKVAIPEMKKYKYDEALATGAIAAGGTLGILIPPSIMLIIYGIVVEQPIGVLFMAGIIPGILEAVFYIITILILCKRNPLMGPRGPRISLKEKFLSLQGTWVVFALFILIMGGMYAGIFTPTEAGGIGAFGAFIIIVAKRRLSRSTLGNSLVEAGRTAAMVLLLITAANLFSTFLALSRIPYMLSELIAGLQVSRYLILACMLLLYVILGCFMGGLILVVVCAPIFLPMVIAMGFDPIWYGIIMIRVVEMGSITPPVGMSLFVMRGVAPDIPLGTVVRGIIPFLLADFCHVALLVAIPQLATFLPNLMYNW